MQFQQLSLRKFLSSICNSSKKVKSSSIIAVFFLSFFVFTMFANQPLIHTIKAEAAIMKLDNAVDSDSDVDSIANIGSNDSSYINAASLDGTDQVLMESNEGGGGGGGLMHSSSILAPAQTGLVDGRHYSPQYSEGEMIYGHELTKGIQTFKNWRGQWKPISEWKPNLFNASYYDDVSDQNITKYVGDGGSFRSIFYERNNTLEGYCWQFTQQPWRTFIYNWDTGDSSYIQNVQLSENFTINEELQRVRYKNIFPDTDFYAGYNGSVFKEVIRAKRTYNQYPSDPYPENKTFMVLETRILDFNIDLWDDDGNITDSKEVQGILKCKDKITQEVKAYLPLGTAWALFADSQNHSTNVKFRLEKVSGEWRFYIAVNYTLFTHFQRIGDVYIDPSWVIGKGGDSWKDCEFWQTMENETTGYAQLYPANVTGNVTSPINEAQKNWIKIQYQGELPSGTNISIYYNSSRDEGLTDPYQMQLVTDLAQPATNYSLPIQEKYGGWRFVLKTNDSSYSSMIHNVTLFNEPPDETDFSYYKEIEINAAKVSGSGSHSNFPVLIYLPSDSDLASDAQNDGDDIAFSNDTAWLDHENEFFNASDGELVAWVRILSLSTSSNTTIRMYYGNDTMGSQENPEGVWEDSFMGVWHLSELSGDALDSTSYGIDGTVSGVTQGVTGQIDGAYDFGLDEIVTIGDPVDGHLDFGIDSFTFSCWINIDLSTGSPQLPIYKGGTSASTTGYSLVISTSGTTLQPVISDGDGNQIKNDVTGNPFDTWIYCVAVVDRNSDLIRAYVNGLQEDSDDISSVGSVSNSHDMIFGRLTYDFDGILDEIRISNVIRSADWLVTIYNSQDDPDSFFDVGSEQLIYPALIYFRPNGVGSNSQLKAQGDSPAWKCVDEDPMDHDATYARLDTVNNYMDLYVIPDSNITIGTIHNIIIKINSRQVGGSTGDCSAWTAIRTYSTTYWGSQETLGWGYTIYSTVYTTNPFTGSPWTWTEIDNLEIGVNMSAGSGDTTGTTQVWAEVRYTVEPNYRLEWEHQADNIPYTTMDSFNLTIYGYSSDSEDYEIQLWNITASDWINTSQFIEQSETWYNFSIDDYEGVIDSNITWRYLDNITSSDTTQGSLRIDYAGIVYWNYSINLIEATLSLPNYDATLDGWQNYIENPLEVNISSLYNFDVEVRGVDGVGNPVSNSYIRFDIDSNPAGGTNLTTSYQVLYNDQTAGEDLQLTFWLFFAYPRLGGNEGTTFTMTLYIRIINA